MSESSGHEYFEELAAGYSLHALEPGDEQTFLAHLDGCAECRRSLAGFSEVAASLAMTAKDEPPAELPTQVWASIATQLDTDEANGGAGAVPLRSGFRRHQGWLAVAAGVIAVAVGVVGWNSTRGVSSSSSVSAAVADCRDNPACQVVQLSSTQDDNASAYLLITGRQVRAATTTLPAIDAARQTYVLWQMPRDGSPVGLVAFTGASEPIVAQTTLAHPYVATTAFAISREAGTTIPPTPSTPLLIGAATST